MKQTQTTKVHKDVLMKDFTLKCFYIAQKGIEKENIQYNEQFSGGVGIVRYIREGDAIQLIEKNIVDNIINYSTDRTIFPLSDKMLIKYFVIAE